MRFDCLVIVSVPCTKNPVFFWQSLQILTKKCRETKFYSVQKSDTKVEISSVCWEMEGEDDIECFADDSVHNLCGSFVYLL